MIFHTPEEFLDKMKSGDTYFHVPWTWGFGFCEVTGPHPYGRGDALKLHQGDQATATSFREAHDYMEKMSRKQETDPDMQRAIRDQRSMEIASDRTLEQYHGLPKGSLEEDRFNPETWADHALDEDLRIHGTDEEEGSARRGDGRNHKAHRPLPGAGNYITGQLDPEDDFPR